MIIRVAIGPAVDAMKRVSYPVFFGNGHPNYPAYHKQVDGEWVGVELEGATHCAWDDTRLTFEHQALVRAIESDPSRVPEDATEMTHDDLVALYQVEIEKFTPKETP